MDNFLLNKRFLSAMQKTNCEYYLRVTHDEVVRKAKGGGYGSASAVLLTSVNFLVCEP